MNSSVFLRRADRDNPLPVVTELLEGCGWREVVHAGARVVVKPNLCTERLDQIHTANTSIGVLRAVCEVLQERTRDITIVESNGARYPTEAAFENHGVYRLVFDEYGFTADQVIALKLVSDPNMVWSLAIHGLTGRVDIEKSEKGEVAELVALNEMAF